MKESLLEAAIREKAASLRPGERVSVEEGIQMTVDSAGRIRFQVRVRTAGRDSKRKGFNLGLEYDY